ncbi:MAG TPA: hypothetical protein VHS55_03590 [Solirubrobacteraceae bacterium]|jgi:hypothetical protein|nr:hypothetical protein [Solirubrobacteraceae bacterium]
MRALGKPIPARRTIPACGLVVTVAAVALGASAPGSAGRPVARTARIIRIQEHGRLKFTSERGATLIERGTAYGTYTATMIVDLTIHPKSVTATVTIYPHGGTITGSANASYRIVKNLGYFGGTLNLGHGTGKYSHIAEVGHKPLGISGVINRENFEVEVKANGEAAGV